MAKLVFNYGAMGSSKSANALMVAYNYTERNQKAIILKPDTDTRESAHMVSSRIGLKSECTLLKDFLDDYKRNPEKVRKYNCVIVDEVQFATPEQIDTLSDIVDLYSVPVLCYGLRADFKNKFFPGSGRLMEIADEINEIKTVCWCGKKAICNARYGQNGIIRKGAQVVLGANEKYVALCRRHYKDGNLGPTFRIRTKS